ncbi:MAG TPA: site-specific integrase [Anaerolineae bacterium]|nr:site-specific integrase [Anaerolineae bacterium]
MINRSNGKLVKKYLKYRKEIDQVSSKTIGLEETWLRHTLEWLDERPIEKAPKIRPVFSEYVLSRKEPKYSSEYIRKLVSANKRFIEWVSINKAGYRHKLSPAWLRTIKLPRLQEEEKIHEFVTYEEIQKITNAPIYSLRDQRIRAAAVLWFLSGIRIGAFVTLPIRAVNLENYEIYQFPSLGVHTKFGKSATTDLLLIPELLVVVKNWDRLIRSHLPDSSYWFSPLSPKKGTFDSSISTIGANRSSRAYKDLKDWLERVGLPFHSPHKFRHGYAVFGIKNFTTLAQLKALSQNLMHSNISITDGIYGMLSNADKKKLLSNFNPEKPELTTDLNQKLDEIITLLKQNTPINSE